RLGMSVAAREVAGLCRYHDFVLRQRSHVECLVGAGAGRENVGARDVQRFEQSLSERGEKDTTRCGDDLQAHARVHSAVDEAAGEGANVTQATSGAASSLCYIDR